MPIRNVPPTTGLPVPADEFADPPVFLESLQAATRAWRDGADIDWVVSALLHDIGDIYAPYNHDEYAATIIRPFVREQCSWVVQKHGEAILVLGTRKAESAARRSGRVVRTT